MTVRDLITQLLDCNMDSDVVLCDDVKIETENGEMDGSVYGIISVEPDDEFTFLNFDNRNHWKKVKKAEPCEDCISREEALECFPVIPGFGFIGSHYNVETIRHQLRNCPSVQPKAKSEWIPIKTRPLTEEEKAETGTESDYMYDCLLPDDGEEVEITTYLGDVTLDVFCRDSSNGCYFEHYCDDGEVLAWRHKPEPYKEGGESKE